MAKRTIATPELYEADLEKLSLRDSASLESVLDSAIDNVLTHFVVSCEMMGIPSDLLDVLKKKRFSITLPSIDETGLDARLNVSSAVMREEGAEGKKTIQLVSSRPSLSLLEQLNRAVIAAFYEEFGPPEAKDYELCAKHTISFIANLSLGDYLIRVIEKRKERDGRIFLPEQRQFGRASYAARLALHSLEITTDTDYIGLNKHLSATLPEWVRSVTEKAFLVHRPNRREDYEDFLYRGIVRPMTNDEINIVNRLYTRRSRHLTIVSGGL